MSADATVDEAAGRVCWSDRDGPVEVEAPGAFAARRDAATGDVIVLKRGGELGLVLVLSSAGQMIAEIEPPPGYSISHFAGEGAAIVCQGESSDESWWDWIFEVDAQGILRRTGPAY